MGTYKCDKKTISIMEERDLRDGLFSAIRRMKSDDKELVIDLEETTYMSSAGLRAIMLASKYAKTRNMERIVVINASKELKELFVITGFDSILIIS